MGYSSCNSQSLHLSLIGKLSSSHLSLPIDFLHSCHGHEFLSVASSLRCAVVTEDGHQGLCPHAGTPSTVKGLREGVLHIVSALSYQMLFAFVFLFLQVQSEDSVLLFVIAWTITEIIRYSFYTFSLLNHLPYLIKWAR